jgi:opacity protein-like surface antigen
MLRKSATLGSVIATLCATTTLANPCMYKTGFLAGAHVGIANGSGTFNTTYTTNVPGSTPLNGNGRASKTSALFGIFGGYRHLFHEGFTLGFDISGDVFTSNELKKRLTYSNGIFTFEHKLSRRYSVIPSINLGKIFCGRWHAALGLGLGIARFQHKLNAITLGPNLTSSQTKVGFVPSVAVEYAVNQNVSVIGKVSYEIYNKVKKDFGAAASAPFFPRSTFVSSISPRYLTLSLGASYRF